MTTYIIRRLMHAALVILIVSLLVFLLMRLLPGDPILMYVASGDMQSFSTGADRASQARARDGQTAH